LRRKKFGQVGEKEAGCEKAEADSLDGIMFEVGIKEGVRIERRRRK
jgi:hypothetical protein